MEPPPTLSLRRASCELHVTTERQTQNEGHPARATGSGGYAIICCRQRLDSHHYIKAHRSSSRCQVSSQAVVAAAGVVAWHRDAVNYESRLRRCKARGMGGAWVYPLSFARFWYSSYV